MSSIIQANVTVQGSVYASTLYGQLAGSNAIATTNVFANVIVSNNTTLITTSYSGAAGSVTLQPGLYTFNVYGAAGGVAWNTGSAGGSGRYVSFTYPVLKPIVLQYVIGGTIGYYTGGGATYLYDSTNSRFICVAGGGGGGGTVRNASTIDASSTASPGTGNGGTLGTGPAGNGAGGGGITGDGQYTGSYGGGFSYANGSAGGSPTGGFAVPGGFGGGGGSTGYAGGGGGGYTGGNGGSSSYTLGFTTSGAGGTSYLISGATLLADTATSTGNGNFSYVAGSLIDNLATLTLSSKNVSTSNIIVGSGGGILQGSNVAVFANSTGTGLMVINSLGQVGIGITTPSYILDVRNTAGLIGDGLLGSTSGNQSNIIAQFGSGSSTQFGALKVMGTRSATGSDWTTTTLRIQKFVDVTQMGYMEFGAPGGNTDIAFGSTGGTERMRITSGGNVGIGTTNPGYAFHTYGGSIGVSGTNNYLYYAVTNSTSSGAYMMFDAATAGGSGRKYQIGSTGTGNNPGTGCFELYDATGGATRFVCNSSGNIGIGITNPPNAGINMGTGGAGITWGNSFSRIYDDGDLRIFTDDNMHFQNNGGERMQITTTGTVYTYYDTALSYTSSGYVTYIGLNKSGTVCKWNDDMWFSDPQNGAFNVRNGNDSNWGTLVGIFSNQSTRESKKDVTVFDQTKLESLYQDTKNTKVCSWHYKGDPDYAPLKYGPILDDSPPYFTVTPDGESLYINQYVAMLHGALQVAIQKIETLETRLSVLENNTRQ